MVAQSNAEVVIIGGGLAGLSAAIYLGRAKRDVLVVDSGKSMARWEPDVQNYLGFPKGIAGEELLRRGREQAECYGARFLAAEILKAKRGPEGFLAQGKAVACRHGRRLLIATGIRHLPPEIDGVEECLGHSMFFCKDCDGFRVRGKRIAVYGRRNEAAEYALAMTFYSASVILVTDGKRPKWNPQHAAWIKEYQVPVYSKSIVGVGRRGCEIRSLKFQGGLELEVDALFITRGDIYFNKLARDLGAQVDAEGEVLVDLCMRTNVSGLYAAGCVTPANCQLIIAAGQGATAAQTINRDLFEESLATHSLRRFRSRQLKELVRTGSNEDRKTIWEANPRIGLTGQNPRKSGQGRRGKSSIEPRRNYGKH